MQHQIAVITLGVADLARSRRFYGDGFGWRPVFTNDEIDFYQMNGLVFGTWRKASLEADMRRAVDSKAAGFALAHNVRSMEDVASLMARLLAHGGDLLREADAPPHGGYRGYVADPDGHAWEIAWNPAWPIDDDGHVAFAL